MFLEVYAPKNPGDIVKDVQEFSKTVVSTLVSVGSGLVINTVGHVAEAAFEAAIGLTVPKGMFGEVIDYSE